MLKMKLAEILERHAITRYRLAKESGLSTQTVYAMVERSAPKTIQVEPFGRVVEALGRIIGQPLTLSDVLELTAVPRADEHG